MKNNIKFISASLICLLTAFMLSGCFQQTMNAMNTLGTALGPAAPDIDHFLQRQRALEARIDKIADNLFYAMASEEEMAKVEEMKKKLNETTDDKEKYALRQQITESELATVEKRSKDKELQQQARRWDRKKQKYVQASWYNLGLSSLQLAILVSDGYFLYNKYQRLINSTSNAVERSAIILRLTPLTLTLKNVVTISLSIKNVFGALSEFMSAAKIEAKKPTSAADKPMEVEGGI